VKQTPIAAQPNTECAHKTAMDEACAD
jgi:hypothetical protein